MSAILPISRYLQTRFVEIVFLNRLQPIFRFYAKRRTCFADGFMDEETLLGDEAITNGCMFNPTKSYYDLAENYTIHERGSFVMSFSLLSTAQITLIYWYSENNYQRFKLSVDKQHSLVLSIYSDTWDSIQYL